MSGERKQNGIRVSIELVRTGSKLGDFGNRLEEVNTDSEAEKIMKEAKQTLYDMIDIIDEQRRKMGK